MFSTNIFIFLALAVVLGILSIVTLFLARHHDRANALAGPLEQEAAVTARIEEKRLTLSDIEGELVKRREALAHVAQVQAELDALTRQRDDLLAEWNQSAARRAEVEAMRHETEASRNERLAVDADLSTARADLDEVRDRLARAEDLVHRIAALTEERDTLSRDVDQFRDALRELQEAEGQVAQLRAEAQRLAEANAALDGRITIRAAELSDIEDRLVATRATHADLRGDLDRIAPELAGARQRMGDLTNENAVMTERLGDIGARLAGRTSDLSDLENRITNTREAYGTMAEDMSQLVAELAAGRQRLTDMEEQQREAAHRLQDLAARKAALEHDIDRAKGIVSGVADTTGVDPLLELRQRPQVIERMLGWHLSKNTDELEAIKRVQRRFDASGLHYPERTLRAFHTAMKVNDSTQMAVLAGISGTGKSQLPRHYAAGMGIGFLQVPVQPRWDSPQDLMGFYNYIEGRFRPTDMARALYALDGQNNAEGIPDRMLMVLLDEMNLARVEYYFSDFLSRLESRPARGSESDQNLRKDAEIELEIPRAEKPLRIFPGYNLLFAGTMNEDESTQSLSDKVVDRANVMRFGAPKKIEMGKLPTVTETEEALSRKVWDRWCMRAPQPHEEKFARDSVENMLDIMQNFGKPFGHRLGKAILAYATAYPNAEGVGDRIKIALADQIEMRLLPKLRGVDVSEMTSHFDRMRALASELGDDQLAEAIRDSVAEAETGSQQFVWKGVIR